MPRLRAGGRGTVPPRHGKIRPEGARTLSTADCDTDPGGRSGGRGRPRATVEDRVSRALASLLVAGERYSAISVETILSTARVARSTFYVYFEDKHHVLRVVGREAVDGLVASVQGWRDIDVDASRDDLRAVLAELVATYRANSAVLAALTEAGATDSTVRGEVRRMFALGRAVVAEHAREQQELGGVRAAIDTELTTDWIVGMLENGLYRHVSWAGDDEVGAHVDVMADLVWVALYAGAPRRD